VIKQDLSLNAASGFPDIFVRNDDRSYTAKKDSVSFKDVFKGVFDSRSINKDSTVKKSNDYVMESEGDGKNVKNYKEVCRQRGQEAKPVNSTQNEKSLKIKEQSEGNEENEAKASGEKMIENLSLILEIAPSDIHKLLEAFGIDVDNAMEEAGVDEMASALAEAVGLEENQTPALKLLLQIAANNAGARMDKSESIGRLGEAIENYLAEASSADGSIEYMPSDSALTTGMQLQGVEDGLEKNIVIADSLNAVAESLRIKLLQKSQEFKIQVHQTEKLLFSEPAVKAAVLNDEAIPDSESVLSMLQSENPAETEGIVLEASGRHPQEKAVKAEEGVKEVKEVKEVNEIKVEAFKVIEPNIGHTNDNELLFNNAAVREINGDILIKGPEKPAGEIVPPRNEIVFQIVEKAKVVLDGKKSEMVMDLKPDNLGKLSLKVVTENGIVMAKFVAESQQVKQVIETNMQLLRDSLEKQGMHIQGFSVSVRQESSGGFNENNSMARDKQIQVLRYGSIGENRPDEEYVPMGIKGEPYYNWGGSSIDLTA